MLEISKNLCISVIFSTFARKFMKQQINHITSQLRGYYPEEELQEIAIWIIEEATNLTRTQILTSTHACEHIQQLQEILTRLQKHEPIQYIFEHTQWMGLDLRVTPATLIPRPETAELIDWIISTCDHNTPLRIIDIGTGTGCIAIALKQCCPKWIVQGIDISLEALEVAASNAERNNVEVAWKQMDILTEKLDFTDIIVSNPPYICLREKVGMDARVLDYEPHTALFVPDNDPLLFYRHIALMKSAKKLYFEVNEIYGEEVCEMMQTIGYTDVELKYDIYGKARMVFGRIEA